MTCVMTTDKGTPCTDSCQDTQCIQRTLSAGFLYDEYKTCVCCDGFKS